MRIVQLAVSSANSMKNSNKINKQTDKQTKTKTNSTMMRNWPSCSFICQLEQVKPISKQTDEKQKYKQIKR